MTVVVLGIVEVTVLVDVTVSSCLQDLWVTAALGLEELPQVAQFGAILTGSGEVVGIGTVIVDWYTTLVDAYCVVETVVTVVAGSGTRG